MARLVKAADRLQEDGEVEISTSEGAAIDEDTPDVPEQAPVNGTATADAAAPTLTQVPAPVVAASA